MEDERLAGSSHLMLVVDAGGTKTAAWLVDARDPASLDVLGRGHASAGNPLSSGFNGAIEAIARAIDDALTDAGQAGVVVPKAVLSVAGSANHHLRDQINAWAKERRFAKRVAVVSDVLPILAAGAPQCQGVALVAGTGSVAFARGADGQSILCGGWGYLLGDEGSGYAIGRTALRQALLDMETSTRRPLTDAVLRAMEAKAPVDITRAIYRDDDPRAAIAAIAPIVINAAEGDDPDAQGIVETAAHDLAGLAARAVTQVKLLERPIPIAVAGGVFINSRRIQQELELELRRRGVVCTLQPVDEPLMGCVCLADDQYAGSLVTWCDC